MTASQALIGIQTCAFLTDKHHYQFIKADKILLILTVSLQGNTPIIVVA